MDKITLLSLCPKSQAAHIYHQILFVVFCNLSIKNAVGSILVSKITQAKLRYLVFTMPRRAACGKHEISQLFSLQTNWRQPNKRQFSFLSTQESEVALNSNMLFWIYYHSTRL